MDLLGGIKPDLKGLRSQRPSRSAAPLLELGSSSVLTKDVTPAQSVRSNPFSFFTGEAVKATG